MLVIGFGGYPAMCTLSGVGPRCASGVMTGMLLVVVTMFVTPPKITVVVVSCWVVLGTQLVISKK